MPVKRRAGKRRMDWRAELEAWKSAFECGTDFFDELGFENDVLLRAAMPEVWARLGGALLDEMDAQGRDPRAGRWPFYALEQFGDPRCR